MPNTTPLFTVADQLLVNFFDQTKGGNYVSHIIEDMDNGNEFLITMQRIDGETPLQQLAQKTERVAELEHALTQALALSQRDSEHFGGQRKDITERIKETLVLTEIKT